ncbi:ABC transporter permease [Flammeovirga agarivorans]|uniref:FtsX-like permease family protein n=1 Tax=Flammeovirga agarivorans TaxID=2726742 RepID=A0A7X8XWV0_9BACT|nr:FtsX-like permease family protein [Flammeovirga agarivorans]NLR92643.1 FtsX-like permease family protein [Flammeovirga agarivorans]
MRLTFVINNSLRDLRQSIHKIGPFIFSIVAGIGSLVAMMTFSENVNKDLESQTKELLGADLELRANHILEDSLLSPFASKSEQVVKQYNFASIAFNPETKLNRMVDLRALELGFPFYGKLEVSPEKAWTDWEKREKIVLVDSMVLLQLQTKVGDSLQFGKTKFKVAGIIKKGVGQSAIMAATVPIVYFPFQYLSQTGLVQKGSRVNYRYYFKYGDDIDFNAIVETEDKLIEENAIRIATAENNTARVGRFFNDIDSFLKLVTFVSLLLGCIGVSSGIYIYIKGKLQSVAILRCLGATSREAFMIYSIQIRLLGLIGGILGAIIGSLAQLYFPVLFSDLLMVNVSNDFSLEACFYGIILSVIISILFGWYPLLQVLNVSPIYVLRNVELSIQKNSRWKQVLLVVSIGLFVYGFAYWQMQDYIKALVFLMSILVVLFILFLINTVLIRLLKSYDLSNFSFSLKYGISQLFRPNNQTYILGITIGLGVFLIICMVSVRAILIDKVENVGKEGDANLVFYDVQKTQVEPLYELIEKENIKVDQDAPVVTMSLTTLNNEDKKTALADSTKKIKRWVFDREYRVTYRSELKDNEQTVEGTWVGSSSFNTVVPISISENFLESSGINFGDTLVFDVQGFPITTTVSHVRAVDFAKMEANFVVLFPSGVLENAPAFHVLAIGVKDKKKIAKIQSDVLEKFPNVSTIDLGLVFSSLNDILDRVAFVFQWLGGICILTGFLVLWSSMSIGKYQRKNEAGILRTFGAKRKHLVRISFVEYFAIGTVSTFTGLLLGWIGSWLLAYFVFDMPFFIALSDSMIVSVLIISMTVAIGVIYMRSISKVSALQVLKN